MRGVARHPLLALALALAGAGPAPAEDADYVVHTVQRGQTLWARADQHGVDVDDLVRLNRIEDVLRLPVGLRIVISKTDDADRRAVDERLARAEWALRTARFEEARARSEEARELLEGLGEDAGTRARLGHLELVAASLAIAFGREDAAVAHIESARASGAPLPLSPELGSPKLRAVLREAERRSTSRNAP